MYDIFTQWITLSVIFFLVIYNTSFLEVVTLGGLIAGSCLISVWMLGLLGCKKLLPGYMGKALVVAGTAVGVDVLCTFMPGYSMDLSVGLLAFIIFFAAFSIWQNNILNRNE